MRSSGTGKRPSRRESGEWEETDVTPTKNVTPTQQQEDAAPLAVNERSSVEDISQHSSEDDVPIIIPKKIPAKEITKVDALTRRTSGYFDEPPVLTDSNADTYSGESVDEEFNDYSGESVSEMPDDDSTIIPISAALKNLDLNPSSRGSFILAASSSEDELDDEEMDQLLGGLVHVPKSPRTNLLPKSAAPPVPEIEDGEQLISIPKSSKIAATLRQGAMSFLSFSSLHKNEQYDLPSRVKWQLWCEVLECKLTKKLRETSVLPWQLYVKIEVGRDAHFEVLTSKPNEDGLAVLNFGTDKPPRERFTLFHRSRAKCRISVWNKISGGVDQLVADCSYPLKKLESDTARVGWVKLKAETSSGGSQSKSLKKLSKKSKSGSPLASKKNSSQSRELRATVKVGFLLSHSMMASWLFLIDFEADRVLYYTRVETLGDLNPVFHSTDRNPFSLTGKIDSKQMAVHLKDKKKWLYQVSILPAASKAFITGANHVLGQDGDSFHCTVELIPPKKPQVMCSFTLSGSLNGKVEEVSVVPFHRYYIMLELDSIEDIEEPDVTEFINNCDSAAIQARKKEAKKLEKHEGRIQVAEAQWRNKRDMKMEIRPDCNVDVAAIIAISLSLRMLQKQHKKG